MSANEAPKEILPNAPPPPPPKEVTPPQEPPPDEERQTDPLPQSVPPRRQHAAADGWDHHDALTIRDSRLVAPGGGPKGFGALLI